MSSDPVLPQGSGKRARRAPAASCRQPTCGCANGGVHGDYCSGYCAAAEQTDTEPGACSCGHAECQAMQESAPPSANRETKTAIGSA